MPVTQFHQQVRDPRYPRFDPKGHKHIRTVPMDAFMEVYRALEWLHEEVEMAESVGTCLPSRAPSLNASGLLARYAP